MLWGNQKGQMAIFIALFFQVIFVFFAMAINVGLVVHDKINLQNAVDIAAYYGAMKQAEVLNQIAHINYQMRQNYKLFAWRYRVLGTLGHRMHPLNSTYPTWSSMPPESPSWDVNSVASDPNAIMPSICVAHSWFREVVEIDPSAATVCETSDFQLPAIPQISPPVGFVPGSGALPSTLNFIQDQLNKFCLEAGIFNWYFAARILVHFREEGLIRKNMIWRLANNLSLADPRDLKGESVREGVRKTFERNLTQTNLGSIQAGTGQMQYMNSMAVGQCQDPNYWLPEIKIRPVLFFSDWDIDANNSCQTADAVPNRVGVSGARTGQPAPNGDDNLPSGFAKSFFQPTYAAPLAQAFIPYWRGEPNEPANQPGRHSSVGYEKNPWCMVYTGIQAQTLVRKPFDPTGQGITLTAQGFAKPFGGRIGPWFGKQWPQGSASSVANSRQQMVDPLLPSRALGGGSVSSNSNEDVVNYSRFPGDNLGLTSWRAMGAFVSAWRSQMNHTSAALPSPMAFANYDNIGSTSQIISLADSLPRIGTTTQNTTVNPNQRNFELAAVAPDVFDLTYYSIDPRYHRYYWNDRATGGAASLNGLPQIWDIGSSNDGFLWRGIGGTPSGFGVREQIELAANPSETYEPNYEPIVRDWEHLLNSWHQKGVVDFGMDPARFGVCATPVTEPNVPTPGDCIRGGRVGYSVKLISRDFLESSDYQLGGGGGSGPLVNAPSTNGF